MNIEITKGDSAGTVIAADDEKAARMIAAGVAVATDKKPAEKKPIAEKKSSKFDKPSEK
jgi:hypothetical protein